MEDKSGKDFKSERNDIHLGKQGKTTIYISLPYWEEKIISEYAEDNRMQALLEQGTYYYERLAEICVYKKVHISGFNKEKLGKALAKAGNYDLGKRWLAGELKIPALEAQKLLNKYNEIFCKTGHWKRGFGAGGVFQFVSDMIGTFVDDSMHRCLNSLPREWGYLCNDSDDVLTFEMPNYQDIVQAEKFFRHHFEREISIRDNMVHLPIRIESKQL